MWPFKNKFEKLKESDVNNAIYELEQRCNKNNQDLMENETKIAELTVIAKREKIREVKLYYVKQICSYKNNRINIATRNTYILTNIELLQMLKNKIQDNDLIKFSNGIPLNKLLSNQKQLRGFLIKSLQKKGHSEQVIVNAIETFNDIDELSEKNSAIYGANKSNEELLAEFEREAQMEDDSLDTDDVKEENTVAEGEK